MSDLPNHTPKAWWPRFFRALAEHGIVTRAAEAAGITRATAYEYKRQSEEFQALWAEAEALGVVSLEDEARRRAREGSDRLMEFMLRAWAPDRYKDRQEVHLSGGLTVDMSDYTDDDLCRIAAAGSGGAGEEATEN